MASKEDMAAMEATHTEETHTEETHMEETPTEEATTAVHMQAVAMVDTMDIGRKLPGSVLLPLPLNIGVMRAIFQSSGIVPK